MRRGIVATAALIASLLAVPAQAGKKNQSSSSSSQPWAAGVSAADKKKATALFEEGAKLMDDQRFPDALDKLKLALASWNNPSIHYNMARCLNYMQKPLEAYDELIEAMRYGAAGLDEELYAEAEKLKENLEGRKLSVLVIKTTQDGVKVEVDGKGVLEGEGKKTLRMLPGPHQVVVTMKGYQTDSRPLSLDPGKTLTQEITLDPEVVKVEKVIKREGYDRRWDWWVPLAVAGGGLALAGGGGIAYSVASTDNNNYQAKYKIQCMSGCTPAMVPAGLKAVEHSAIVAQDIDIALFIAAGAAIATGGILAYMNRPEKVPDKVEEPKVIPEVNASRNSVTAGFSFVF